MITLTIGESALIAIITLTIGSLLGLYLARRQKSRESGENRVPICPLCQKEYTIVGGKPEATCPCELMPGTPQFYRQDMYRPLTPGYTRWLHCAECTTKHPIRLGGMFLPTDAEDISDHIEQHIRVHEIRTHGTPLTGLKEYTPPLYHESTKTLWGWRGAFLFADENPWQVRLADAQILDQGENTLLVQHLEGIAREVDRKIEQLEQDLTLPNSPVGSLAIQRELARLRELVPIFETVLPLKESTETAHH